MVQRCSCILLLEWERSFGPVSDTLAAIAPCLMHYFGHNEGQLATTVEQLTATVQRMVGIGSRYKNLEDSLSAGVTLCLGTSVSESSWSKFLPKSGVKFDAMVERIRSTDVGDLAPRYAELRIQLVSCRMNTLQPTTIIPQPPSSLHQSRYSGHHHHDHVSSLSGRNYAIPGCLDPMLLWTTNSDYDTTQYSLSRIS